MCWKWANESHGECFIAQQRAAMITPGSTFWQNEGVADESVKYNTHTSLSRRSCIWPVSVSRKHLYEHMLRYQVWCVNNIKQVTLHRKQSRSWRSIPGKGITFHGARVKRAEFIFTTYADQRLHHTINEPCSFIARHYLAESERTGSSPRQNYSNIAAFWFCFVLNVLLCSVQFDLVLKSSPGSYPLISHVQV